MAGPLTLYQTGVHGSRPAASSGCVLYSCTTHSLIYKSDGASWTTFITIPTGSGVATDPIFDAAGDLAVGTGADTAAKLAKGSTDGMALQMVSGAVAWANPAVVKLGEQLLGSDTATFDFTSIPATFRALELHFYVRGTRAATVDQVYIRLNNDATSTWDWEFWNGSNTIVSSAPTIAGTFYCANMPAASMTANYFGGGRILIPNYALTTGYKTVISNYSEIRDLTNLVGSGQHTGFWRNTAAVSQVTLVPGSNNFKTGSLVTLYGYM